MSLLQRFLAKVQLPPADQPLACWIWLGAMRNEYGSMSVGKSTRYAHQVAYSLYRGKIDPTLKLLHSCDNPRCVNPNHLTQDTQLANVIDGISKGRIKLFVQQHPQTPSTVDVSAVLQDAADGMSHRRLAKKHQMAVTSVRRVLGVVK